MLNQLMFNLILFSLLVVSILVAACGSSSINTSTSTTSTIPPSEVSFSQDIQTIFNLNCVICHQGTRASGDLNLEPNAAYHNIVNKDSMQSSMKLVSPSNSENSYLWHKLDGTHVDVGGSGVQMPYNSPPLTQHKLDMIRKWIDEGAQDN